MTRLLGILVTLALMATTGSAWADVKRPAQTERNSIQEIFKLIGNFNLSHLESKVSQTAQDVQEMKNAMYQGHASSGTLQGKPLPPSPLKHSF